jgi:hypothetical protein
MGYNARMSKARSVVCPKCGNEFVPPPTPARVEANRRNAKRGGRPKGAKDTKPRKPRKNPTPK